MRLLLLLVSPCLAIRPVFRVKDDVLAFPQYAVHFSDEAVSELQAQSRMVTNHNVDTNESEYDILSLNGRRYLCSIPQVVQQETVTPAPDTELELARANDRGWELLQDLQGHCVYYWAGWWSYRFCYGSGVKQFHQMLPRPGVPAYPPAEDTSVTGFVLGREGHQGHVRVRGDTRFLVQNLRGGDPCDLTGVDRTIEIQYHCNPAVHDSISMIKEVATCAYLMIVDTPRLCHDVAFSPPEKGTVHQITCSTIMSGHMTDHKAVSPVSDEPIMIGDIVAGAHKWIPADKPIEKSAIVGGGKETFVETIADSMGKVLTPEQLKKMGLGDPKTVEKLRKQLDSMAGEKKWKLKVFDTPRGREYRGVIDDEDDKEDEDEEKVRD